MLRDAARAFLAKESPSASVRKVMETEHGYDSTFWTRLAGQGWTALGIPEEYGGYGSVFFFFFFLFAMGVPALLEAGTASHKQEVLSAIAAGKCRAALAFTEPSGRWDATGVNLR